MKNRMLVVAILCFSAGLFWYFLRDGRGVLSWGLEPTDARLLPPSETSKPSENFQQPTIGGGKVASQNGSELAAAAMATPFVQRFSSAGAQATVLVQSFLTNPWTQSTPPEVARLFASAGVGTLIKPQADAEGYVKRLVTTGKTGDQGYVSYAESYHWVVNPASGVRAVELEDPSFNFVKWQNEQGSFEFSHARFSVPLAAQELVSFFAQTERDAANAGWRLLKKDSTSLRMEKQGWEIMLKYFSESANTKSDAENFAVSLPSGVPQSFANELTVIIEANEH